MNFVKNSNEMFFVLSKKRSSNNNVFFDNYFKIKKNYYAELKPIFEHLV